jgi:hypothetical protein
MGNGRGRRSTLGCARPTHASICLNLHILITPSDFLFWTIFCRYPPVIRRLGAGLLVSRHARYIHLTCQRRSLDDFQSRYSQRPRVCLCLGVRSRSCHLVRNLVTRKPTTDTDTRTFSPFSLRFWDLCRSVSPRIPDDSNLQNTTWKMCLMSFSTGKPHPLASRPTLGQRPSYLELHAIRYLPHCMEGRTGDRGASVSSHLPPALTSEYP